MTDFQKEILKQYPAIEEQQLKLWENFTTKRIKTHFYWPNVFILEDQASFCMFKKNNGWYMALIDDSFPKVNEPKHTIKSTHDMLKDVHYQVLIPFSFLSKTEIEWCYEKLSLQTGLLETMGIDMSF
jgi:hypothetical protein